jgi:hypothetical protein
MNQDNQVTYQITKTFLISLTPRPYSGNNYNSACTSLAARNLLHPNLFFDSDRCFGSVTHRLGLGRMSMLLRNQDLVSR